MYRNVYYDSREEMYRLFTWDKNGERVILDCSYSPYLYVESKVGQDAKSLFGTQLKKKTFRNQHDRRKYISKLATSRVFENISCDQQFLADMYWKEYNSESFSQHPIKTYFIDIETYSPADFPHPDKAKDPINVITLYDTSTKRFITWGTSKLKREVSLDGLEPGATIEYIFCPTEFELLSHFVSFMERHPPDVISGWNSQFFDIPYIIMRVAKVLGDDEHHRLSPVRNVYCRTMRGKFGNEQTRWYICGVSSLDYLDVYQKFSPGVKESYKLDAIAEVELGDKKIDYGSTNLSDLATNDWQTFVEYNIQDVNLLVKMDDKLQYIELLRMLAYTGLTTFEGAMGTLGVVTGAAVIKSRQLGVIMPTFIREGLDTGKNPGAYVGEPQPGFQESILSFDANSLYPNTMISMNLSPETKIGKILSRDDNQVEIQLRNKQRFVMTPVKFENMIRQKNIAVTKANILFSQNKKGIIPGIVDELYSKRVECRDELTRAKRQLEKTPGDKKLKKLANQLNIKQYTIKILINSIYGYFGNKLAPFGDDDIAASITLTGQGVIKQSNKILTDYIKKYTNNENVKNPVIYNDTDSSYISIQSLVDHDNEKFQVDGVVTEYAYKQAQDIEDHLNTEILKWGESELNSTDCRFVFKRECMGDVGVFLQKKRYVLHVLDDEGFKCNKYKYTGVEVVRSTMPASIKPYVKNIIETMMSTKSLSETNAAFKETYKKFKELPIEDIAFVMSVKEYDKYARRCSDYNIQKGTPIHVKAAYLYNLLVQKKDLTSKYELITNGDKVRYYYVNVPNKLGITSLGYKQYMPEEFRDDFPPDKEMMFEKIVFSVIDRFYHAVNWSLQKPSKQVQTDLFELLC